MRGILKVKGIIKTFAVIFAIAIAALAFSGNKFENDKTLATVDRVNGVYLFINAKPVSEYTYLGTVKVTFSVSGQFLSVRDKLMRKIRKDFPQADAITLK